MGSCATEMCSTHSHAKVKSVNVHYKDARPSADWKEVLRAAAISSTLEVKAMHNLKTHSEQLSPRWSVAKGPRMKYKDDSVLLAGSQDSC